MIFGEKTGKCIFLSTIFTFRKRYIAKFLHYIIDSTNELSPTRQKDVIPTKGCSNCAKLEQELATYKNEYFPFMLLVKNLMFGYFEEPIPPMELER